MQHPSGATVRKVLESFREGLPDFPLCANQSPPSEHSNIKSRQTQRRTPTPNITRDLVVENPGPYVGKRPDETAAPSTQRDQSHDVSSRC